MKKLFFSLLLLSSSVAADNLENLTKLLEVKTSNTDLMEDAVKQGHERAWVCKYCHGDDGNSTRKRIPNLASQNPQYLLHQFELFANKQRNDQIMSELANNLTSDDRVNIALYYSSQKVHSRDSYKPELQTKGQALYEERCIACHGKEGYGKATYPRIAGQPVEYLANTLTSYKTNPTRRPNSPMQGMASSLSGHDIQALIAYISAMK